MRDEEAPNVPKAEAVNEIIVAENLVFIVNLTVRFASMVFIIAGLSIVLDLRGATLSRPTMRELLPCLLIGASMRCLFYGLPEGLIDIWLHLRRLNRQYPD
jgi:hypothetical protein